MSAEVVGTGNQGRAATGLVALVGHGDAIDLVMGMTFDDGAILVTLLRATAGVAYTGHGNAIDLEVRGADAGDLAAVGGGVTETNELGQGDWVSGR